MSKPGSLIRAGAYDSAGLDIETPWHFHHFHQLLYAFEGSVVVEDQSARYKVPHQFAAWIPANTVHRTAIQNVRSGSLFFRTDLIDWPQAPLRVIQISNLMREMIMYAMRWPIHGEESADSVVYFDCFARLCSEWIGKEVTLVLPSSDDVRINAIAEYTREHLAEVSVKDVCSRFNMSERSLRRHFLKAMGINWEEYRLRLRIYRAIDALDNSSHSIATIADAIGYTSQSAFANSFKTMMGITPSAYRKTRR